MNIIYVPLTVRSTFHRTCTMDHQEIQANSFLVDGYLWVDVDSSTLDTSVRQSSTQPGDQYLSLSTQQAQWGVGPNYVVGHIPQSINSDTSNNIKGPWGVTHQPPSLTNVSSEGIDQASNGPLSNDHYLSLTPTTTEEEKAAQRACVCQLNMPYTLNKYLNDREDIYGSSLHVNELSLAGCHRGTFLELSVWHSKASMKVKPPRSSRRSKPSTGEPSSLEGSLQIYLSMSGILEDAGAWAPAGLLDEYDDHCQLHISEMLELP